MDNNETSFGGIYNKDKTPELCEKEKELTRKRGMELLQNADNFLVVGTKNGHCSLVSGVGLTEIPNVVHALTKWLNFCMKARQKIDNFLE